ncbi:hypothetical protein METP3_03740 [Methanosarcinales archaeon]|nr:hypothetical protein METP3_03740 [Methanosarcinales archaeon]
MTYEKTKVGVLIGFISAIVALLVLMLFVPISTIFLALVLGLLFALPVSALVLVLISGASIVSKKMRKLSKSEKIPVVISTSS